MSKKIQKALIVLKPTKISNMSNLLPNISTWLIKRKVTPCFLDSENDRIIKHFSKKEAGQISFLTEKEGFKSTDLVISLGGDGTLIGTCRRIVNQTPIFGVNLGKLGFITEFNKNELFESLEDVVKGKFELFNKPSFKIEVERDGKIINKSFFINDAVFSKNNIARMFDLTVSTDKSKIFNVSGDGLIVSSTTGSTAYSLAAGGPIVHPDVKGLILTPVCPHALNQRPMVIPNNLTVNVKTLNHSENIALTLDGQQMIEVDAHDTVHIKLNRRKIFFIKNNDKTYFDTLKEKFFYGKS
jgi:NAD+ kinase